jgi:release factor glutamine methyltransferase
VIAVECSAAALEYAERNAAAVSNRLAVMASSVDLVRSDVTRAWGGVAAGSMDAVVCNPPYIPDDAVPRDPEVREHDPDLALYGGTDGMAVIRPVIRTAARILRSGGLLAIEHGDTQGGPGGVPGLLERARDDTGAAPFREIQDHEDLAGRPRFTTAVRT